MKTAFSVALVAAVASADATTAQKQKLSAFNNLVMNSQWNGAALHSSLPEVSKLLPKHNSLYSYYPEYDWDLESMLTEGCDSYQCYTSELGYEMCDYLWTTEGCGWTAWCLEGRWLDKKAQTRFACYWQEEDVADYNCAKYGDCPFNLEEFIESTLEDISRAISESALNNGLDVEEAQFWFETISQEWDDLYATGQAEDEALAIEQASEVVDYVGPIIDGMVTDITSGVANATSGAIAELQDSLAGLSMQKYNSFNKMVGATKFNGKPLAMTLDRSQTMPKPNVLYPEYNWADEEYLAKGCYGEYGYWYTDGSIDCSWGTDYCIQGYLDTYDGRFSCYYTVSEEEYNCAKWGECGFDLEAELEKIAEKLAELAVANGFKPEKVEQWLMDAEAAWTALEESQQQRADELAMEHAGEASDMFGPVIDGMLDDLSDAVNQGLEELQDMIPSSDNDEAMPDNVMDDVADIISDKVVLAEKDVTKKHHKHTAAYVAGGVTLFAAAIGAAYLLKKRQERKGINEALINDSYVREQTI